MGPHGQGGEHVAHQETGRGEGQSGTPHADDVVRILLALFYIIYYLSSVHSQRTGVLLGLGLFIVVLILLSKRIQKQFMRIETIFMDNLNERELRKTAAIPAS